MTTTTEALVIGGGPVGLFAALSLLKRGVSVAVLDAAGERAVRGYACGLHARTLRMLERAGLAPAILAAGHRVDRLVVHTDPDEARRVDFEVLNGKYPYALTLRQFDLEEILEQALDAFGLKVQRGHTVDNIRSRDGCVTVTARPVAPGAGEPRNDTNLSEPVSQEANYVIGADGYFSACRRVLGIDLVTVRPTQAFAVCEFQTDLGSWQREAHIAHSADGVCAFWPLGPQVGRFTCQIWKDLDQPVTLDRLRELLRERAPWFTRAPEQLSWAAVAPFEQRLARNFGQGRMWLAGDAAHTTSPIGFQSMNLGLHEVDRLSDLVASALFDEDHRASLFQRFERNQQREWNRLFARHLEAAQKDHEWDLAPCMPASGRDFEALMERLEAPRVV
jgi:2-polyprenyl-6-methoxyphenol hydroxylase-like FAD-dependent oxidoreductase